MSQTMRMQARSCCRRSNSCLRQRATLRLGNQAGGRGFEVAVAELLLLGHGDEIGVDRCGREAGPRRHPCAGAA